MNSRVQIFVRVGLLLLLTIGFLNYGRAGEQLHLRTGKIKIRDLNLKNTVNNIAAFNFSEKTNYYILQFIKPISPQEESDLALQGIEKLRYIPDDAFVVRAQKSVIKNFADNNKNVSGFAPYLSEIKLEPELKIQSVFNKNLIQSVRLHLFSGVNSGALAQKITESGILVDQVSDKIIRVRLPTKQLNELSHFDGVEWISRKPNMQLFSYPMPVQYINEAPVHPGDFSDWSGYETGTRIMGFEKAWLKNLKGVGQIVGVSDTGLDTGARTTLSKDFSHLKDAYALGYSSDSWADIVSHGTHVSGSVGGMGELSNGLVRGGAYEAGIVMQSLWSQEYMSLTTPDDLAVIFEQAYKAGARIHTNSWGDPGAVAIYNSETEQVDEFVWNHPDMLILFAVGNEGIDGDADGRIDAGSVCAPATAKNVLSVGASENLVYAGGIQKKLGEIGMPGQKPWPAEPIASDLLSNNPQGLVAFSSRGPTVDGRIKPEIVAPGSNILSNCSKLPNAEELWGKYNGDYCWSGGTSMSTPLTAGAAAIVREHLIKNRKVENPSSALVKALLLHTAFDLYPGQFGEVGAEKGQELLAPGPNADQGYGRVDLGEVVVNRYDFVDHAEGLAKGEELVFEVQNAKKITLVYNDAPGSPAAEKALVNDLDLLVENGGSFYKSESRTNNSEQVVLPAAASGIVKIKVRAMNVPMGKNGKQPFAVVYTL